MERGILTVEIEKARPRFWPCAIRGHPEVDVAALQAQEKAEQEPFYKPPPDAEAQPRRVNDRETLLKLKAEFPQLAASLPVEDPHTTTHRNHAGPRKTFDWGALPTDADEEGGPGGSSGSNSNSSTSGVGSKGGTTAVRLRRVAPGPCQSCRRRWTRPHGRFAACERRSRHSSKRRPSYARGP